jgi:hypothetical protein
MLLLNNNAYFLILFSFILVIIAHFKIAVLGRATMDVFDVLNEKIEKRFAYVKEQTLEDPLIQLEDRPFVLPNEPKEIKKPMLDSETLTAFHKLDKSQKQSVFLQIATSVKDLSDEAFRYLWNSCYVLTEGYQGAFEIQTALLQLNEIQYKACKEIIVQESRATKRVVDVSKDDTVSEISEVVTELDVDTVGPPPKEVKAIPDAIETKKRGRKAKQI